MIKFWYSMDLSEIVNYMNYEAALDIFLSSSHDPLQAYPVAEIFCCTVSCFYRYLFPKEMCNFIGYNHQKV